MSDTSRSTLRKHPVDIEVRRYPGVLECDVIVTTRGRELIVTCPDYERALRWARMECKSYGIAPRFTESPAGQHAA